ncbi:MAG: hypothetical protein QOI76_3773 [Frankiales bacterium]|nr:hypothetical protein [Frankiales bacterium]
MNHGEQLARAIATKDSAALLSLLDPEVDFKGLTPHRFWEGASSQEVLDVLLGHWFEPDDQVTAIEAIETGTVADRERLTYRFHVSSHVGGLGEELVTEQQAYFTVQDGRINYLRMMCSGFRPTAP